MKRIILGLLALALVFAGVQGAAAATDIDVAASGTIDSVFTVTLDGSLSVMDLTSGTEQTAKGASLSVISNGAWKGDVSGNVMMKNDDASKKLPAFTMTFDGSNVPLLSTANSPDFLEGSFKCEATSGNSAELKPITVSQTAEWGTAPGTYSTLITFAVYQL